MRVFKRGTRIFFRRHLDSGLDFGQHIFFGCRRVIAGLWLVPDTHRARVWRYSSLAVRAGMVCHRYIRRAGRGNRLFGCFIALRRFSRLGRFNRFWRFCGVQNRCQRLKGLALERRFKAGSHLSAVVDLIGPKRVQPRRNLGQNPAPATIGPDRVVGHGRVVEVNPDHRTSQATPRQLNRARGGIGNRVD